MKIDACNSFWDRDTDLNISMLIYLIKKKINPVSMEMIAPQSETLNLTYRIMISIVHAGSVFFELWGGGQNVRE